MKKYSIQKARLKSSIRRNQTKSQLMRRLIMGTSAMASFMLAPNAFANSVTGSSVTIDASPLYIAVTPLLGETAEIVIDTQDLTGWTDAIYSAGNFGGTNVTVAPGRTVEGSKSGMWLNSFFAPINVVNNGTVKSSAAGWGMYLDSYWGVADGGDISVSGTGTIEGGTGIYAHADTGKVKIDGLSLIKSTVLGIGVDTYAGVDIGLTQRLGKVDSDGAGILIRQFAPADPAVIGDINIKVSDITANGGYGIQVFALSKDTNIDISGVLKSANTGVIVANTTGNVNVVGNGTGSIDGGDEGITIGSLGGNVRIADFKSIKAADTGIWAGGAYSSGSWMIENNGSITGNGGTGVGVWVGTTTGDITVRKNGLIEGKVTDALTLGSNSGKVTITDNGTLTGARNAIWSGLVGTGAWNISNNGPITGTAKSGIEVATLGGNIDIKNNGNITGGGVDAIWASAAAGNITIADNGVILGADDGIEAYTTSGTINVKTTKDVTGTADYGIYTGTTTGENKVDVAGGNVTGGNVGLDAFSTAGGNVIVTVASGSRVMGTTYGMIFGSTGGVGTMTNRGLITDTNAPSDNGGDALWMWDGANTSNNYGTITGRVHSNGTSSTLNNFAGAVWNPGNGSSLFNTANDAVYNSGLINIRAGQTTFYLLDKFENRSGGIIDMTVGSAPTDDLLVYNFSPLAGSRIKFNFDASAAAGLGDDTASGTADTIRVFTGNVTASGQSFVDIKAVGGQNGAGEPVPLTGSVALIYTGTTLKAPGAGDKLTASDNYMFGTGNPSTAKRVFTLVEDGKNGVFLQWQPNINANTMGAFAGGNLNSPQGSGIATASSGIAGITGSGGVGSSLADMSAGGATDSCIAGGKDKRTSWAHYSTSFTDYKAGGDGNGWTASLGWEAKLNGQKDGECGRSALGWFSHVGESESNHSIGNESSNNYGLGIYYRRSNKNGTYVNLLASATGIDANVYNGIFETKADKRSLALTGDLTAGYNKPLENNKRFDLRASVTYTDLETFKFFDTAGFFTDGIDTKLMTIAASAGLAKYYDDLGSKAYGRLGIKRTNIDTIVHTYGIDTAGDGYEDFVTAEAGLFRKITVATDFGAGVYGDFSSDSTGYGLKLSLRHVW